MGSAHRIPVVGRGTAAIKLNGKLIVVRNALHVPGLRGPLYSLRAHLLQDGCGFLGLANGERGRMGVWFPHFVLDVDLARDCHLSYVPVGKKVFNCLDHLDYVQRSCKPHIYGNERPAPTVSAAAPSSRGKPQEQLSPPHLIEDEGSLPPSANGGPPRQSHLRVILK